MVTCLVVMDGKDALSALVVVHITSVLSHCKRAIVCAFGGSFFFFFSGHKALNTPIALMNATT